MNTIQYKTRVVANKKVCGRFFRLTLDAGTLARKIKPGQFIHIRISDGLEPFSRRPFSVFNAGKYVEILYDVVGRGTQILSEKKVGEKLDILGPLGNNFVLPLKGIKKVVMIAGGVGVAPFLILSQVLKQQKKYELVLLYGGRTKEQIIPLTEFKKNGCQTFVSTDDASVGKKGRIPVLFSTVNWDKETFVYTCGPRPMMAAVQAFAQEKNVAGQASCEEVMACGLGACRGCVVKTTSGYKTVCYDGPVFDLQEIIF